MILPRRRLFGLGAAFLAVLIGSGGACRAETVVVDGDTLRQDGVTYRLAGVDAPERRQTCADGWPAGAIAADALRALVLGKRVTCDNRGHDRYGRTIAMCAVDSVDIGYTLTRSGLAWAYRQYSTAYVDAERQAIADRAGVHGHQCVPAWEWRKR